MRTGTLATAAAGLAALLLLSPVTGCGTRSTSAMLTADSTRVFASSIPGDVDATIGFALKDSDKRAAGRRLEREHADAIKDEVRDLTRAQANLQREQERRHARPAALENERPRESERRAKTSSGERKKARSSKAKADGDAERAGRRVRSVETSGLAALSDRALADSLSSLERAIAAGQDSLGAIQARLAPREERSYEIEEGAKVVASVRLENPWGRGHRPMLLHFLWVDPDGIAAYRKAVKYAPNDSSNVLTSSFGIGPTRRAAGHYNFRVYLFRELVAEKDFELTGVGLTPKEEGESGGM